MDYYFSKKGVKWPLQKREKEQIIVTGGQGAKEQISMGESGNQWRLWGDCNHFKGFIFILIPVRVHWGLSRIIFDF